MAKGVNVEKIQLLEKWVQGDLQPDVTLLFDVPVEVSIQRLANAREPDKFERENADFFTRIRNAYLQRAKEQYEKDNDLQKVVATLLRYKDLGNITADNLINQSESRGNVAVTGQLTGEFKADDVVTMKVNGVNYVGHVLPSGAFTVVVRGSDLKSDAGKDIEVSVAAHDAARGL